MLRRELKTTDGAVHWLLISQVEHARIGGLLAAKWTAADVSPYECDGQPLRKTTADEILAAISHHDDGWLAWEKAPRVDPTHGRPYSFMNELPFDESTTIWNESIGAAREIGPLAGWLVAGHFSQLLENGNRESEICAAVWLATMRQMRAEWLSQWQRASKDGSLRVAERALQLLQACDFLSLWLCCDCPVAANEVVEQVAPFVLSWPEEEYEFSARRHVSASSKSDDRFAAPGWLVSGAAWPFDDDDLQLAADAWLVPARRYADSQELLAARRPVTLRWRLTLSARRRGHRRR